MRRTRPQRQFNRADCLNVRQSFAVVAAYGLALFVVAFVNLVPYSANARPLLCEKAFDQESSASSNPKHKIDLKETATHWVSMIHFGDSVLLMDSHYTNQPRKVVAYLPSDNDRLLRGMKQIHEPVSVYLMPFVPENLGTYFAVSSFDQRSGRTEIKLYNPNRAAQMKSIIETPLELTWKTFAEKGVVGSADIESFKETEDRLPANRKTMFVATKTEVDESGLPQIRTLAVMRFFDGSPLPVMIAGVDRQTPQLDFVDSSDIRLPIEHRYPHLNFRLDSNEVSEAGRLAGAPEYSHALPSVLFNMGAYLESKHGFDVPPSKSFLEKGRNYIEITGQHLEAYMRPVAEGGFGYTLFAASMRGKKMSPTQGTLSYEDLNLDRGDEAARFILYKNYGAVIRDFYVNSPLQQQKSRIVPSLDPNQEKKVFESPFDKKYHRPVPENRGGL